MLQRAKRATRHSADQGAGETAALMRQGTQFSGSVVTALLVRLTSKCAHGTYVMPVSIAILQGFLT
jgi:hypothetical protein